MSFSIVIDFDDVDIKQLVDAYNETAGDLDAITVQDVIENLDDVQQTLREYMFDKAVELLESENEEVYDTFCDVFHPIDIDFDGLEDFEEQITPPRTH